jgi:hypothetical protein
MREVLNPRPGMWAVPYCTAKKFAPHSAAISSRSRSIRPKPTGPGTAIAPGCGAEAAEAGAVVAVIFPNLVHPVSHP